MRSSVLHSDRPIEMNIAIMQVFVRMRELIEANKDIAARIGKLNAGMSGRRKSDTQAAVHFCARGFSSAPEVFEAIGLSFQLSPAPEPGTFVGS